MYFNFTCPLTSERKNAHSPLVACHVLCLTYISERTSVGLLVRDALGKIIANRPEDPMSFLAD